jgi:hypothetical protein
VHPPQKFDSTQIPFYPRLPEARYETPQGLAILCGLGTQVIGGPYARRVALKADLDPVHLHKGRLDFISGLGDAAGTVGGRMGERSS